MEIKKDPDIKNHFLTKLQTYANKAPREGLHLTDLLNPMKAYWARIEPRPPSFKECLYFLAGKGHENYFLHALGEKHAPTVEWEVIYVSPDFEFVTLPVEFKTRRKNLAFIGSEAKDYFDYLQQLKGYCVAKGVDTGILVVFALLEKMDNFTTEPVLEVYKVTFEEWELEDMRLYLLGMRDTLKNALESKDPSNLPYCPKWMCVTERKKLVSPAKCLTCGTNLKANQINKHVNDMKKKKLDYSFNPCKISPPEYKVSQIPNCRWLDICKTWSWNVLNVGLTAEHRMTKGTLLRLLRRYRNADLCGNDK